MDPKEALRDIITLMMNYRAGGPPIIAREMKREIKARAQELEAWCARGGFAPDVTKDEFHTLMSWIAYEGKQ